MLRTVASNSSSMSAAPLQPRLAISLSVFAAVCRRISAFSRPTVKTRSASMTFFAWAAERYERWGIDHPEVHFQPPTNAACGDLRRIARRPEMIAGAPNYATPLIADPTRECAHSYRLVRVVRELDAGCSFEHPCHSHIRRHRSPMARIRVGYEGPSVRGQMDYLSGARRPCSEGTKRETHR